MSLLSKLTAPFKKVETSARQKLIEELTHNPTPRPPAKRKQKKPATATERTATIALLKKGIQESGYKSVTVKSLLAAFGYQKRSEENVHRITHWLAEQGLTIYPKLSLQLKASEPLRIYGFPVVQLGDLFEPQTIPTTKPIKQQRERELEDYIDQHHLYRQLGLTKVQRQHSPQQTRDRFDFLCQDKDGNLVALELKHAGGGKTAVEQVLRYIGMLKQDQPLKSARGILITGVRDVDTAKALHGMTRDQQAKIDWYLYDFDKKTGSLGFKQVKYDFIEQHLQVLS